MASRPNEFCPICCRIHPASINCQQFERLQEKAKVSEGKIHGLFDNTATQCREVYVEGRHTSSVTRIDIERASGSQKYEHPFGYYPDVPRDAEGVLVFNWDKLTHHEREQFKKKLEISRRAQEGGATILPMKSAQTCRTCGKEHGASSPCDGWHKATAAAPQDDNASKLTGYRKLSVQEVETINSLKSTSSYFLAELRQEKERIEERLNGPAMQSQQQQDADKEALRWLAIARTTMQQACMAAVRAVAKPEDDS